MKRIIDYFSVYGVDANTVATAFITILIFVIGLFFTWLGRQVISWKEKRSYKKSLLLILNDFRKACQKQVTTVNKSLASAGLGKGNDFIIQHVSIGTLDYLNKLDFNIFLSNFEPLFPNRLYSKAISKLFELIAQIKMQNESIGNSIQTYMDSYKVHEKSYYENLNELRRIHDDLGVRMDGQKIEKSDAAIFIQTYFNIFGYFVSPEAKLNIASTYENVVSEILSLTRKNNTPLSAQVSDYALKCDISFQNIEKIDRLLVEKLKDFVHFHKRAGRLMKVIVTILK